MENVAGSRLTMNRFHFPVGILFAPGAAEQSFKWFLLGLIENEEQRYYEATNS
jgi:hypothetical protein